MNYIEKYQSSLDKITHYNFKENNSFVFYKHPNDTAIHYILADRVRYLDYADLTNQKSFLFAPFDVDTMSIISLAYHNKMTNEEIIAYADELPSSTKFDYVPCKESLPHTSNQQEFMALVNQMKAVFQQSPLKKMIASRIQTEAFDNNYALAFLKLCEQYNHAFNYFFVLGGEIAWMGASPELLIHAEQNKITSMSLAGTQPYQANQATYKWTDKEMDEQQIVSDAIKEVLEQLEAENINISEAQTHKAGNLVHLRSMIAATLKDSKDLAKLVEKLHPTPAVCGMPKELAKEFILLHEKHHRQYYSGFLGEWDTEGKSTLYVNLRCASFHKNQIHYYAGCGITAGSNPEAEWIETERKIETLKNILQA